MDYNSKFEIGISKQLKFKIMELDEAFKAATLQSEGYESSMRTPIFKNGDGTYEIGGIQDKQWSDISDGTFEEIGSVKGWDVNIYDFGEGSDEMTKEEKAEEVFNQNETEWFNNFKESFEL